MPVFEHRKPFELCSAEHMTDYAETIVSAARSLSNPQPAVAELLSDAANVGYLLALEDLQIGFEELAEKLHNGHPAVTGMLMAKTKIAYVHRQIHEFIKKEAEKAGVSLD